jgi:hypothetical protein
MVIQFYILYFMVCLIIMLSRYLQLQQEKIRLLKEQLFLHNKEVEDLAQKVLEKQNSLTSSLFTNIDNIFSNDKIITAVSIFVFLGVIIFVSRGGFNMEVINRSVNEASVNKTMELEVL